MVILTTSGSAQTFEFTPRATAYNTMIVTNEATNVPVTVSISSSVISTYYHTIVPEKSRFSVWFSVFSTEAETETEKLILFRFKPKPKPKN